MSKKEDIKEIINNILFILMILCILCLIIGNIIELVNNSKVIKQEKCIKLNEKFYCEVNNEKD